MSIIENAKEIADLIKKIGDIELYRKIIELEGEIIDLTRALRGKEDLITELERSLHVSRELTFRKPFYYSKDEKDPYCANCWETKKMVVHAIYFGEWASGHRYECPNCKTQIHLDARADT